MRVHITLSEQLVRELDNRVGARGRSPFIAQAIKRALDDEHRWELIASAIGSIPDHGHEWDDDPAAWVARQRRDDVRRLG